MTPDLMKQGAQRFAANAPAKYQSSATESGGRDASYGRIHTPGEVDVSHGRILYLEDVSVSFDGFKAINKLSLDIAPENCAASLAPMVREKPP
jgi:urea transport system ATP-binding protein